MMTSDRDPAPLFASGYSQPHLTDAVNVAGYISWGSHSSLGHLYALGIPEVTWLGNSGWWLIETIESFNGLPGSGHGKFTLWFSENAFGGGAYSNTPVGGVTHTDEPSDGWNDPVAYFGLWARRKNFAICAWNSRRTPYFQAVGDPFVAR